MADRQQQYRGKKENMPVLLEGELGFCTDTKELYIGSADGNVPVGLGSSDGSNGESSDVSIDNAIREALTGYATEEWVSSQQYLTEHQSLEGYAKKEDIPDSLPASDVYSWAKEPNKPSYSAEEVGADVVGSALKALEDSRTYIDQQIRNIPKADLSINDETADGYVKGREFYDSRTFKYYIKDKLFSGAYTINKGEGFYCEDTPYFLFNAGDEYHVSIYDISSETQYDFVTESQVTKVDNEPKFYIGNPYLDNYSLTDNGLPFCIYSTSHDYAYFKTSIGTTNPMGMKFFNCNVSVYQVSGELKQINEKYIPETYVKTLDLNNALNAHSTNTEAHNDIRLVIQSLVTKVNDLLDSDDTTLDQMSEIVAYIKGNRELIESVTTSKVNVSDIIDNLITNMSDMPLSAAQGVRLKALIDSIKVPVKVSELQNDSEFINQEGVEEIVLQTIENGDFKGEDGKAGIVISETEPIPYEDGEYPVWLNPEGEQTDSLATMQDIENVRKEIPSFDRYVTEDWVKNQKYLTEHQDLSDYAKKSELPTKTSQLTNDSGFLTNATVGKFYKGAWIATECTGISQKYTETITLPAGTYLVLVTAPFCSDFTKSICISFSAKMAIGSGATFIDAAYGTVATVAVFTATTNLTVLSGASANDATWSYLDRGGLVAVRIV